MKWTINLGAIIGRAVDVPSAERVAGIIRVRVFVRRVIATGATIIQAVVVPCAIEAEEITIRAARVLPAECEDEDCAGQETQGDSGGNSGKPRDMRNVSHTV